MVFINFKKSEKNNFVLQVPGDTICKDILSQIIELNNIRIYLDRLIWSVQQLANKGVLKPPELQAVSPEDYAKNPDEWAGLEPQKIAYAQKPIIQAPYRYKADKHHQRYGVILPEKQQKQLLEAVKLAKSVMQPTRQPIKKQKIVEAIQTLRLAVMMAYPAYLQLPEWEPAYLILQQKLDLLVLESENFEFYDEKAKMWWAGKQLNKSKLISQYVGGNQKTRIILKLQKAGGEQPLREPPVDAKTYQQMVKYYYKKVDQTKQFQKRDIQTHYEKVQGQSMKQKVHLADDVRYKPF